MQVRIKYSRKLALGIFMAILSSIICIAVERFGKMALLFGTLFLLLSVFEITVDARISKFFGTYVIHLLVQYFSSC